MSPKALFLCVGVLLAIVGLVAVAGVLDRSKGDVPSTLPQPTPPVNSAPKLSFRATTEGLPLGGEWRGGPALADLNGDSHLDIVCCVRKGDGLYPLLGDGKGGFTESIEGIPRNLGYGGSDVADFDGDGILDIAFSTHGTPVQVLFGNKDGKWTLTNEGVDNHDIMTDLACADVDNDGDPDIVSLAWSEGGLTLFENLGKRKFKTRMLFPEDRRIFGKEVQLADVDSDGNVDIIATYFGPKVMFGDGKGGFESRSKGLPVPLTGGVFQGLDTADLDGDGILEVGCVSMALTEERLTGIGVFRLGKDGSWVSISEGLPVGEHYYAIKLADMNGDGRPDMIASGVKNRVEIFLSRADDTWSPGISLPESSKRAVLDVGDFNHDGLPDLLEVYAFRPGGVRVWLQNERGTVQVAPPGK